MFLIQSNVDIGEPVKLKYINFLTFTKSSWIFWFLKFNRVSHDTKKLDWKVKDVKIVYSKNPNYNYVFPFQRWLESQNKYSSVIECQDIKLIKSNEPTKSGKLIYFLTVFTGDLRNAGTNANVFVEIGGNLGKISYCIFHNKYIYYLKSINFKGKTAPVKLENNNKKDKFERGQKDHFNVRIFEFNFFFQKPFWINLSFLKMMLEI